MEFQGTIDPSTESAVADPQQKSLAELESTMRESARHAARKCAHAMLAYVRANPHLLFAEVLPIEAANDLRAALTGYVATLRALAVPPERMIVAVKELVSDAAADARIDTRGLTGAAVTWAIAAYFPPGGVRAQ